MKEFLETKVILEGLKFPEGPRWHGDKLWFSDMRIRKVMTVELNGKSEIIAEVPNRPSGLGWLPDGRLLIVSMENRHLLRLDPAGLTEVADLSELVSYPMNDMVVDKEGRAYIGNFGFDYINNKPFAPTEIILVSPQGDARIVADNMAFPNGMVITPDDKTLIVAETFAFRLTAFDIADDGSLTKRRIWANLESLPPDGMCLDAEGAIWVATPNHGSVIRVLEGGEITHKVSVATEAYACMLGGPDRDMLFICTATKERTNGRIECVNVDVPGAGLP
ncbi:MAG: SMP-30/gluconolactonase/LRE family protein [Candidatus Odinarchaeota archaeon]